MDRVKTPAELCFQKDLKAVEGLVFLTITKREPTSIEFLFHFTEGIYEGRELPFRLSVKPSYPFEPPKIHSVIRKLFHPSVCPNTGAVCLNILSLDWRPTLSLEAVLVSLFCLFTDDTLIDAEDCLNQAAGEMYLNNCENFKRETLMSVSLV